MILATSTISPIHSAYSRYDIPLIGKFSTSPFSIFALFVNIIFDIDEFDTINARIMEISSEISESMIARVASRFESVAGIRGDSLVTDIRSMIYSDRTPEFIIHSMKFDFSCGDVPTRAIYCF